MLTKSRKPSLWTTPRMTPRQSSSARILRAIWEAKIAGVGSSRTVLESSETNLMASLSITRCSHSSFSIYLYIVIRCIDIAGKTT